MIASFFASIWSKLLIAGAFLLAVGYFILKLIGIGEQKARGQVAEEANQARTKMDKAKQKYEAEGGAEKALDKGEL